jgi:hypothetical protein
VLQSTFIGSTPTAVVNGRVLRVGESINGFKVVEITARACVVEQGEVKVRLEMSSN